MRRSPWWYRNRDSVFGAIYGAGFFVGGFASGMVRGRYVPVFVDAGGRFGNTGIVAVMALMLALMIACFALRVWGSSYLHSRIVWSEDARTDALVVAGPFRFTRNPLYLGNILMALSFGAFAPFAGWIAINILNLAYLYALIRWEEIGMRERHPARFVEYCRIVPRLFPRLVPAPSSGDADPSLRQGFASEIFTGSLLAAMFVLLVNQSIYGWSAFAVLFVAGIVAQHTVAGRETQTGQLS